MDKSIYLAIYIYIHTNSQTCINVHDCVRKYKYKYIYIYKYVLISTINVIH